MPSEGGGKFEVLRLQASDWGGDGLSINKEIHLTSAFGLRTHKLDLSFHPNSTSFFPLFMLVLNFTWGLTGSGDWFLFLIRRGDEKLGGVALERKGTDLPIRLVGTDPKDFGNLLTWFAMGIDLTGEVHGADGIVFDFPIPADPNFLESLRQVRAQMVANT